MKKIIAKLLLFVSGWKVVGIKKYPKKCIVIAAPHTSNWDFFFGKLYAYVLGIRPKYLVKDELAFFPLNYIIRFNGGIPVDRSSSNNLVLEISNLISKSNQFILGLSPEGTRSKVLKWRTGFYYIAKTSNIPIVLTFIDFKKKEIGCYKILYDLSDFDFNMQLIEDYYKRFTAKYPDKYNLTIF